jgi:hypothetical protein
VPRPPAPGRSPTAALLLGLIITLGAVVAYSGYIVRQISGLRKLQTDMVDRNRKDSLQLGRYQSSVLSRPISSSITGCSAWERLRGREALRM